MGWPEFANAPLGRGPGDAARHLRRARLRDPRAAWTRATSGCRGCGWPARTRSPAEVVEFARIEAGRPEFLVDMDADTIPLEAGIEDRAISFTKGCYVGQEVIVRVVHRGGGRVARKLVGLRLDGASVPGAAGRGAGRTPRGRPRHERGVVAAARGAVALGYVRREFVEPGTTLAVDCDGTPVPAVVSALPIR